MIKAREFIKALDQLEKDKGIAKETIILALKEAMEKGDIIYAGKYSEPDYETMLDEECDLALESTMINHTPEVKEMIEDLGIPVMIDRASYESDPMGRAEWIKLYGELTDHQKEAEAFFEE